jgi:polyhydroxyalkanoate synthase
MEGIAFVATPVDFHRIGALVDALRTERVDPAALLDDTGNVPPEVIRNAMRMLRPTDDLAQSVNLLDRLWQDEFVRSFQIINNWAKDALPFPGHTFVQCTARFVRENALMRETMTLDGRPVGPEQITLPALVMLADRDHIVPRLAAEPLAKMLGGSVEVVSVPAGHVALLMGRTARTDTVPSLTSWMDRTSARRRGRPGRTSTLFTS